MTLYELGLCVRALGRPLEAEDYFRRVLEIDTANRGPAEVEVALTFHELGR